MRKIAWYAGLFALVVLIYGLGMFTGPRHLFMPSGKRRTNDKLGLPEFRSAGGRLQPSGGVVSIVAPPGDRILELPVRMNQPVHVKPEPTVLFKLASLKDREADLLLIKSQVAEAVAQITSIEANGKAKVADVDKQLTALAVNVKLDEKVQDSKIKALVEQLKTAKEQLTSLEQLDRRVVNVSEQDVQKARQAKAQAEAELEVARANRDAIQPRYDLDRDRLKAQKKTIKTESDRAEKQVPLESLRQQVKLAELRRDRAIVTAEKPGFVLKVLSNVGDSTGPEPVLQLAAGTGVVAIAEVYVRDINTLRRWLRAGKGVPATITSLSVPKEELTLTGKLMDEKDISSGVGRNTVPAATPRADSDRRTVEVRVHIDPGSVKKAQQYIGLEVDVQFEPPPGVPAEPTK